MKQVVMVVYINIQNFWQKRIACFPWYVTDCLKNDASNNSYISACVFVDAVTFLSSRCLAMIGRFLPSSCLATITVDTQAHRLLLMIYEVRLEMVPGAIIYIPSFMKIGSGIQKLIRGIHRQHGDLINLLLFFQIKENRLKWIKLLLHV
jgi:hypothetical protein